MTVFIQLTLAGFDTGPFNLFSNASVPSYGIPFAVNVPKATLLAGDIYTVPAGTTVVRVMSIGDCTNQIDIQII